MDMQTAMERALAPVKTCPSEDSPEVSVEADWSGLLDGPARARVATRERALDRRAAARYTTPERLLSVLEQLLTPAECDRLQRAAEACGFGTTGYPKEYRGNKRLIATDAGLADALWARLRPFVPETLRAPAGGGCTATWRAAGLNERFRLAKYHPGTQFGAHCDACFERDRTERSFYTVNVYLNDVAPEHGGCTRFYDEQRPRRQAGWAKAVRARARRGGGGAGGGGGGMSGGERAVDLAVRPKAGVAAVFRHAHLLGDRLLHDGEVLRGGVKYLLRTDVMYRVDSGVDGGGAAAVPEAAEAGC